MRKLLVLAVLSASACPQPGQGSYFAKEGAVGPTAPQPKPEPPKREDVFLASCRQDLTTARKLVDDLLAIKTVRAVDNTLEPFNDASRHLSNAAEWSGLTAEVHTDPKVRDAARTCTEEATKLLAELSLDHRLFDAIRSVDVTLADADTKRFVTQTLRDFKRAGVELDDKKRARMREIEDQITTLGLQFEKNIAEDTRKITVTDAARLAGMPADWIASHKPDASGAITITTDYPDYIPFTTYADDDDLKKQLFIQFRSRGDAHNEELLGKVLVLRAEKAALLGFPTWADYESDDKMLRGSKSALDFLERVNKLAAPRAKKDYAELLAQLKTHDPKATEVSEWQKAWLENQVKRDKYAVDSAEVRKYFPFDKTLQGLLDTTAAIYDIQYVAATDPRTWAPDVQVFDVMRGKDKLGRIFLDMHPRDGKYKHAAEFPITDGVKGVQLPEAALVCNLPAGSALMDHGDVVTMFHEFGHLMHHVLGGRQHWDRQSGVATEQDFVEAPSQMFEEWAWSYETLSRFSSIPKDLVDKMRKADRFGKGMWAVQQLFYAAISLRFHMDDPGKLDQLAVVRQSQKKYTPFAFVEGTKFHTSFGHLIGYSSRYYTYMWSLVLAKDLLTAFDKKGLLAVETTTAYRDKVLAPGGTKDAADLVKDFLGRPYSFKAFEKYLSEP